jgi:hypothetical protein
MISVIITGGSSSSSSSSSSSISKFRLHCKLHFELRYY